MNQLPPPQLPQKKPEAPLISFWRALPMPARVVGAIILGIVALYTFQILLGLLILAAIGAGIYQIVKWLVTPR